MKLNGIIAKAIKSEQDYMEEKRVDWMFTKKCARQILEDLLPEGSNLYLSYSGITIRVKWGVENLRQARKAVGSGWTFSNNYTDTNGTLTKSYYRYDESVPLDAHRRRAHCSLSLIMDAGELDPNTCKRIEVGEKTFTQKIYKVICDGQVEEMMGKAQELDNPIIEISE